MSNNDDENETLDNDEILVQFEELQKVQICSVNSIAYCELIEELSQSNLQEEDMLEVLQNYCINPFDHIQINADSIP